MVLLGLRSRFTKPVRCSSDFRSNGQRPVDNMPLGILRRARGRPHEAETAPFKEALDIDIILHQMDADLPQRRNP
jgi:hypothetical protein